MQNLLGLNLSTSSVCIGLFLLVVVVSPREVVDLLFLIQLA